MDIKDKKMARESFNLQYNFRCMKIASFIYYQFRALSKKGHGIHSPFIFDLVTNVIHSQGKKTRIIEFEQQRKKLKDDKRKIFINDLGTGISGTRSISSIANRSLTSPRECELLYRIIKHYQPSSFIELGTSLGITTLYVAQGMNGKPVYTIEGNPQTAQVAKSLFDHFHFENIKQGMGDIINILPQALENCPAPFIVYIDGNHAYEPTMRYFHQISQAADLESIIIIHDIHLNADMEKAWAKICENEMATFTIDLFNMGIIFFNKKSPKQHFIIRF